MTYPLWIVGGFGAVILGAAVQEQSTTGGDRGAAASDSPVVVAQAAGPDPSYSMAQALRGKIAFDQNCSACHGTNLRGGANEFQAPPLAGPFFFEKWNGKPVSELIAYAVENMPPAGTKPAAPVFVDIFAYVIQNWKYNPGAELKADSSAVIKPAV